MKNDTFWKYLLQVSTLINCEVLWNTSSNYLRIPGTFYELVFFVWLQIKITHNAMCKSTWEQVTSSYLFFIFITYITHVVLTMVIIFIKTICCNVTDIDTFYISCARSFRRAFKYNRKHLVRDNISTAFSAGVIKYNYVWTCFTGNKYVMFSVFTWAFCKPRGV